MDMVNGYVVMREVGPVNIVSVKYAGVEQGHILWPTAEHALVYAHALADLDAARHGGRPVALTAHGQGYGVARWVGVYGATYHDSAPRFVVYPGLRALVLTPGHTPAETLLPNVLGAFQAIVGGYIDEIQSGHLPAGVGAYCNEDPDGAPNIMIDGNPVLGTVVFFALGREGESGLTDAQMAELTAWIAAHRA